MRDHRIPKELESILRRFEPCFTSRSFENFVSLVIGWALCIGRRTVSRVVMASGSLGSKHFSSLYRFFSRAVWAPDALARILVGLIFERLGDIIEVTIDDTLCRRTGPHFFGAAMHHDSKASTYGGKVGRTTAFAFGHNWVVLAIRLPLPWDRERGIAIPVLVRLYRSKSRCPASKYKKRTELAREMLELLRSWIPSSKRLFVAADSEYACVTLLKALPDGVEFTGPIHRNASLHGRAEKYKGRGRPRVKGPREPSPRERFAKSGGKWKIMSLTLYGRHVRLQVKSFVTRWTKVTGARPILLILTRDPKGKFEDRAYFTTDRSASVEVALQRMARRWLIEVSFRDAKQLFGLGQAQNGWGKCHKAQARRRKQSGPQPRGQRGRHAVERTAPITWLSYAITVLCYLDAGNPQKDVDRVRAAAPWYQSKARPSVTDMLAWLRGQLLARRLSRHPHRWADREKTLRALPAGMLAA